ncbi:uncharacterized protein BJX67DRAFT_314268 [Aspergillus lucknowensis]|uniref:Kinetochore complex Sim4 subunit Fta1-domain-containing protein n=1 Tax=Aspergillus lucknowensis TaxID=176173 RepID=A0ABR4L9D8_9EURO
MASPHHLLNTSWTSHRLSPLHHANKHGSLLEDAGALQTYATRLRDHLTNSLADVQGWRAEDDTAGVSNIGALNTCTWETISTLSFLNSRPEDESSQAVGILITLSYENITYKAALLADPSSSSAPPNRHQKGKGKGKAKRSTSTYLPLLLTRLPKALRESFIAFLSSNFDTYISSLRLSSRVLCDLLESYVERVTPSRSRTTRGDLIEDIIREMQLTLSFAPPIAPSLRALNVSIPRATFASFLRTNSRSGAGGPGTGEESVSGSVLSGLSAYLEKHLAMELGLVGTPGSSSGVSFASGYVRLTRIACAGFVVTGEGRMKIVAKAVDGDSEGGEGEEGERNQGALRGGEALVRAVIDRAAAGIEKVV